MQPQTQYRDRGLVRFLLRVAATACLLAAVAAGVAAVFGALCGLVFWARYGELAILAVMTTRCAVAGAGAGALVGTLGRLLDGAPHQGDLWSPQPLTSTHRRNGYCQAGATPPWDGTLRHHQPFPDRGRRRLAD